MTKKGRQIFFQEKNRVTFISCRPGDTNPSDATGCLTIQLRQTTYTSALRNLTAIV